MLLCSPGSCCVPRGAAVDQSDAVQPPASTTARGLLTSKPLGTAFSSAYFLSKLNCNCGLKMDSVTFICSLTFITICWFSYKAVARQQSGKLPSCCGLDGHSGPGETSATGTWYPIQQGEACSDGECPCPCTCLQHKGRFPRRAGTNVYAAELTERFHSYGPGWDLVVYCNFGNDWKFRDGVKTGEKERSFK